MVKSINIILTAIRWVALAWREVKAETIMKCFRSGGILDGDLYVSSLDEDDPFQDIDTGLEIPTLISRVIDGSDNCSAKWR